MSPHQAEKPAQDPEPEALADLFHRVGSLVPDGQEVLSVGPRATIGEALDVMRRHSYSQLPVVAGDTVVGVFSYRSLSMRLLQMGPLSQPPAFLRPEGWRLQGSSGSAPRVSTARR